MRFELDATIVTQYLAMKAKFARKSDLIPENSPTFKWYSNMDLKKLLEHMDLQSSLRPRIVKKELTDGRNLQEVPDIA